MSNLLTDKVDKIIREIEIRNTKSNVSHESEELKLKEDTKELPTEHNEDG